MTKIKLATHNLKTWAATACMTVGGVSWLADAEDKWTQL